MPLVSNKHFWPRQRESISAKTSVGLKLQTFSPANFSMSTVCLNNELPLSQQAYLTVSVEVQPLYSFENFDLPCLNLFSRKITGNKSFTSGIQVAGNFHFAPGKSFQQHHVHGTINMCITYNSLLKLFSSF